MNGDRRSLGRPSASFPPISFHISGAIYLARLPYNKTELGSVPRPWCFFTLSDVCWTEKL